MESRVHVAKVDEVHLVPGAGRTTFSRRLPTLLTPQNDSFDKIMYTRWQDDAFETWKFQRQLSAKEDELFWE